jgi:hypothetical protein
MRLKWDWIKRLWPLGVLVTVAVAIAAVPGIFTLVNATTGYEVNGSGGTAGYALCSDGTYYDVPCSVTGTGITALTGPVTASGSGSVATTITATGVTAGSYIGTNLTVNAAGQITAASNGFTSGNNSAGYWIKDPTGHIHQWGFFSDAVSESTVSFPTAFTNAASVTATATSSIPFGGGIAFVVISNGTITTTGFEVLCGGDETTQSLYWTADGY